MRTRELRTEPYLKPNCRYESRTGPNPNPHSRYVEALPLEVQQTIAEAMPVYERMYARRLRPTTSIKSVPLAKRKPIGASFSLDEVLFRFKTAHPTAASPPCNQGHLVSLSKPIRAVLSADVLLSAPPPVVAV